MNRLLLAITMAVTVMSANAVIETYTFENDSQRARYKQFVTELRCPKCQNQNLADSDAPIAADLRKELHRMIVAGDSDESIREFMLQRYGDFVFYRPRFSVTTAALWLAPLVLLSIGGLIWLLIIRSHRDALALDGLDEKGRKQLSALLDKDND